MATKTTKTTGKALVKWDEELAKLAQQAKGLEDSVAGGNFISTRGGRLQYNGAEIPDNTMNVIIVAHCLENHYYNVRFDPDNPQSPACFAFGTDDEDMGPHEQSTDPQSEKCKGCPKNEFGTADTGRGKACGNIRRLALIPQDGLEDIAGSAIALLKVPVTSVRGWAGYVRQLADVMNIPPLAAITEISVVPDPKTQFKVQFKFVDKITDSDVIGALLEKRKQAESDLVVPYAPVEEAPAKPARGNAKFAKPQTKPAARGRK